MPSQRGEQRDAVGAGDEIVWQLTVSNVGDQMLSEITAVDSSGAKRIEGHELPPGRRTATTWRTRVDKDAEASITVSAMDGDGNRISEQVSAHVVVRSRAAATALVTPTVSPAVFRDIACL